MWAEILNLFCDIAITAITVITFVSLGYIKKELSMGGFDLGIFEHSLIVQHAVK